MGFFAPLFLAGILAVGLPLWLHLLRQFKRTPQPFSSLMFFERRIQSSVRHRRLRYYTLLSLRLAVLILLALAFANPFINRRTAVAGRRELNLIIVDRSFSMRYGHRMEDAKAEAHRVLNGLRGRSLAQVWAFDSKLEALTQPEMDRAALGGAIDSIQAGDLASSYGELARSLRVQDESLRAHLNVHLISDMQQSSMPSDFHELQLGPHTTLQLHPLGTTEGPNWAVENIASTARVYPDSHPRVTATIAGWHTPAATRNISLVLDGRVIASKEAAVPPSGRATVEFTSFDVPYGGHRAEVQMEPHDDLADDDSFPFSIERSDPKQALFLYAGSGDRAESERQAFYYKAALESTPETGLNVRAEPVQSAAGTDFSKFAFIVLNDPGDLGPRLADEICSYVQKGGAVFIALGPYTASVGRVPLSSDRFIDDHEPQSASYVDSEYPALASAGKFENVQFFDTARLTAKPHARVLAKLASGNPLLIEERMGEGRKLIFAGTLDNATSDFPLHASFVPFAVQTAHYLAGWEEATPDVVAGTPVALRRSKDQGTAADVVGPDGRHELSLSDAAKALTYELDRAGFYEVQRADRHRSLVAVHPDRRESDLTPIPAETLVLWRNTGSAASDAQGAAARTRTQPWSLWRYVLLLALLVVVAESVFGARYLKEESRV